MPEGYPVLCRFRGSVQSVKKRRREHGTSLKGKGKTSQHLNASSDRPMCVIPSFHSIFDQFVQVKRKCWSSDKVEMLAFYSAWPSQGRKSV